MTFIKALINYIVDGSFYAVESVAPETYLGGHKKTRTKTRILKDKFKLIICHKSSHWLQMAPIFTHR